MTEKAARKGGSLRFRIMTLVDLVLLITVGLTVTAATYQANQALKQAWEAEARAKGYLLTRNIATAYQVPGRVEADEEDQMIAQAALTAQLVAVAEQAGLPPDQISARLADVADHTVVDEFLIADETARVYLSNTGASLAFSQSDAFFPLLNREQPSVIHEFSSPGLEEPLVYAGVPGADQYRIVLVGQRANWRSGLDQIFGANLMNELAESADVQSIRLVDADLNEVAAARAANVPQIEDAEAKEQADLSQAMNAKTTMFRWEPEAAVVTTPFLDPTTDKVAGAVVVSISTGNLQRIRWQAVLGGVVLGGLMCLAGGIVSYWMAGRIARPLQAMADMAGEVADGDLSCQIEVRHTAELGQLESALARMTDNLRSAIQRIRASARQVGSSATDIDVVVTELNETVNQQSAAVAETTAAMEELRAVAGQIADGAQAVSASAAHTEKDVESGRRTVAETVARMEEIRAGNEASVKEILALGDKAQQISAVMDLIEDVAAQTKLISINASIEAAAAGEAGERFNVVAGQVRRLAENVAQSTEEIRQRIREIQTATNELTIAAEQNTKKIDRGVALSQTTQAALDQIATSADQTNISASQISISTRQQQTAVEQVVEALHNLSEEVSRVAANSSQTSQVVADLGHLASTLNELVALFQL